MNNIIVVGAQWGDEGKGKVVDYLTERADFVIRYGGGANSGHTIVHNNEKLVTHLLPGGVRNLNKCFLMCDGMVIDPEALLEEINNAKTLNIKLNPDNLKISRKAHIVMPYHKILDGLRESNSKNAVGSTKRGIGPCYEAKAGRYGIRMEDLFDTLKLEALVSKALEEVNPRIIGLGGQKIEKEAMINFLLQTRTNFLPFITNTSKIIQEAYKNNKKILFEGAQGVMLDIDQGTYPFVTSSCTSPAGVALGCGISPKQVETTIGIVKAYLTRVGEGPMPTELHNNIGEQMQRVGGEYGATTGRPRRCGWLDMVLVKHAVNLGVEKIALTKLDVLKGLDVINVCVAYEIDGVIHTHATDLSTYDLEKVKPIYYEIPGFHEDISQITEYEKLPDSVKNILKEYEKLAGIPIAIFSTGPERSQTILLENLF